MRLLVLTAFLLVLFSASQAQEEVIVDKETIIYKDSVGNPLSSKQATDLLKTGKYISVPAMNSLMQMEHIIRKPNKQDSDRYQTYTDRQTVISTTSIANPNLKFNLGDTLPSLVVSNQFNEKIDLTKNSPNETSVLLFYKTDDFIWSEIQPAFKVLIADYPNVNFVICSPEKKKSITDFFDKKTLKVNSSVFLAEQDYPKQVSVAQYPMCMIIDRAGKLLMFVPPLPAQEITIQFLRKYLSSKTRG